MKLVWPLRIQSPSSELALFHSKPELVGKKFVMRERRRERREGTRNCSLGWAPIWLGLSCPPPTTPTSIIARSPVWGPCTNEVCLILTPSSLFTVTFRQTISATVYFWVIPPLCGRRMLMSSLLFCLYAFVHHGSRGSSAFFRR